MIRRKLAADDLLDRRFAQTLKSMQVRIELGMHDGVAAVARPIHVFAEQGRNAKAEVDLVTEPAGAEAETPVRNLAPAN